VLEPAVLAGYAMFDFDSKDIPMLNKGSYKVLSDAIVWDFFIF
jgi:hypothetical protein